MVHNAKDKTVIKLNGKIRSSVGKVDLWHSAVDNESLDMLFNLRQFMASSKTRISEDVVMFIVSHITSPKFLFEKSVSDAGVIKLRFKELCGIELANSFLKT
jgi:hypothetical protein